MIPKILRILGRTMRFKIPGRGKGNPTHGTNPDHGHRRIRRHSNPNRGIQTFAYKADRPVEEQGLAAHFRLGIRHVTQGPRDIEPPEKHWRGYPQLATRCAMRASRRLFCRVQVHQDPATILQEACPRVG